jgi:hypothetical protein
LENEKEEINMLDAICEEKTEKLAHIIQTHQVEGEEERLMNKESVGGRGGLERKKIAIGKRAFVVADKTSARISDKATNVLEKAQNKVEASFGGKKIFLYP